MTDDGAVGARIQLVIPRGANKFITALKMMTVEMQSTDRLVGLRRAAIVAGGMLARDLKGQPGAHGMVKRYRDLRRQLMKSEVRRGLQPRRVPPLGGPSGGA